MDPRIRITRRVALSQLALGAAGLAAGCKLGAPPDLPPANNGRLDARPQPGVGLVEAGTHPLLISSSRDGVLYVPPGLAADTPVPLILLLHGAGGSAEGILEPLQTYADQLGLVFLVPSSRGQSWDAIRGVYSYDVVYINDALERAFSLCSVDPLRVGIAGFSDGATYAIGLGRINGDLFRRIVAFSPGFLLPAHDAFMPPLYITHGSSDPVLPYRQTSEVIIAELTAIGYDITFRGFSGGHWIPLAHVTEALRWGAGGALDPEEPAP
jgi:predicted esterase